MSTYQKVHRPKTGEQTSEQEKFRKVVTSVLELADFWLWNPESFRKHESKHEIGTPTFEAELLGTVLGYFITAVNHGILRKEYEPSQKGTEEIMQSCKLIISGLKKIGKKIKLTFIDKMVERVIRKSLKEGTTKEKKDLLLKMAALFKVS